MSMEETCSWGDTRGRQTPVFTEVFIRSARPIRHPLQLQHQQYSPLPP